MLIAHVNQSPLIFPGSLYLRTEVGCGACQLPSSSCLFPLLFSLSLWWRQGHASLLQLRLVTAMNSMTNPWGFGSPISLGQCHELSRSRCLGCPFPFPCYDSGLHSRWPNCKTLTPLVLRVWGQLLISSVWGSYLYSPWLCKIKLLGGVWEPTTWHSLQGRKYYRVCATLPTIYFREVSGADPNIPSEFVF